MCSIYYVDLLIFIQILYDYSKLQSCQREVSVNHDSPKIYLSHMIILFSGVSCPALTDLANGFVNPKSGKYEDKVTYGCDSGYECSGTCERTCQSNKQWSGQVPQCQSE